MELLGSIWLILFSGELEDPMVVSGLIGLLLSTLLGEPLSPGEVMLPDVVTGDFSTIGLSTQGLLENMAGKSLCSRGARAIPFPSALGQQQSLMASTIVKASLRTKSGPLEFLTGPIGEDMIGRAGLSGSLMRAALALDCAVPLNHDAAEDRDPFEGGFPYMASFTRQTR
jgi:hypothetical protein